MKTAISSRRPRLPGGLVSVVCRAAAARAASSLTGGGGERARLPAHTATDQAGRVEGFDTGSYARKGGAKSAPSAPAQRPATPAMPAAQRPAGGAATPPPPAAPATPQDRAAAPVRSGPMRFSSLSGFRRR